MDNIGYEYLNVEEKRLYDRMKDAFDHYASSCPIQTTCGNTTIMKVMNAVLGDHPDITYFDRTQLGIESSFLGGKSINLKKCSNPSKAKSDYRLLMNEIDGIVSKIMNQYPENEYETVLFLYEFLQTCLVYDELEFQYFCSNGVPNRFQAHNAFGTLMEKKGVCDGISGALVLLLQRFGISCTQVFGKAKLNTSLPTEHAWAIAKINNSYYHLDLTFDISQKTILNEYSYDYFLIDDAHIKKDHEWNDRSFPASTNMNMSYFKKNGMYAYTFEGFERIVEKIAKSRRSSFSIMLDENVKIPENDREKFLSSRVIDISLKYRSSFRLNYIWNNAVRTFSGKFS